jgi:hypothetical protein
VKGDRAHRQHRRDDYTIGLVLTTPRLKALKAALKQAHGDLVGEVSALKVGELKLLYSLKTLCERLLVSGAFSA